MQASIRSLSSAENHDERIRLLSNYGWLASASPTLCEAVIAEARWKRVEVGDRLTSAGDVRAELIALTEGVATLTSSVGYSETPLVHVFRPPFWFGYAYLVGSGPRRFTTVMRTRGWVMTVDGQRLARLLDREPGAWQAVVRLAMKYGDLAATVAGDLLTRQSEKRLVAVLLRCSGHRDPVEGPPLNTVPLTQSELADATNLSRNSVVTILQNLAARNLVAPARGSIQIKNPLGLLALLDGDE